MPKKIVSFFSVLFSCVCVCVCVCVFFACVVCPVVVIVAVEAVEVRRWVSENCV